MRLSETGGNLFLVGLVWLVDARKSEGVFCSNLKWHHLLSVLDFPWTIVAPDRRLGCHPIRTSKSDKALGLKIPR